MPADGAIFFASAECWAEWLAMHGSSEDELWVGFWKRGTNEPTLSWAEAVDEALCHGWIDGIRQGVDDERYRVRFTPRRPRSPWSKRNIERVEALIEAGRMTPTGLRAYEARSPEHSGASVAERSSAPPRLPPEFEAALRASPRAWAFLEAQPPGYTNVALHWVMDAKRAPTRERRLQTLIEDSANGLRIKPLRR